MAHGETTRSCGTCRIPGQIYVVAKSFDFPYSNFYVPQLEAHCHIFRGISAQERNFLALVLVSFLSSLILISVDTTELRQRVQPVLVVLRSTALIDSAALGAAYVTVTSPPILCFPSSIEIQRTLSFTFPHFRYPSSQFST
ncbi:hypothetical protein H4582DRAFT_1994056 [Lactarius indigo]|nr:hypothetical protein H4582DRAFT_1994056 [Lactarius indigo]